MHTQKELAKKLSVSQSTISRAVSNSSLVTEKTRSKILKKLTEVNYQPNIFGQRLRTGRSNTVGLILPYFGYLEGYNTARITSGIGATAQELGYHLIITSSSDVTSPESSMFNIIGQRRIDGVFCILDNIKVNRDFFKHVREQKLPFVFINSNRKEKGIYCVGTDNTKGTYEAAKYLIKLGHRRIAFIGANNESLMGVERLDGYRSALEEAGIKINNQYIKSRKHEIRLDDGYDSTMELLKLSKKPTAVVCYSDYIAIGALKALNENRLKVPEDISVIGFGDIKEASFFLPPLTTVAEDGYSLGVKAMEMMGALLENKRIKKKKIKIATKLILRETA